MDDEIILLSSSEEEEITDSRKSNLKRFKKAKTGHNVSIQKTTPNILKRPETVSVRVPQNNNQNQKPTIIQAFKSKDRCINPLATQVGNAVKSHKIGNVPSTIAITPVINVGNVNSHGQSNTLKLPLIAAKPKTNAATVTTATASTTVMTAVAASRSTVNNSTNQRPIKRLHPTKISDKITIRAGSFEKSSDSDMLSRDSLSNTNDEIIIPDEPNDINRINRPQPQKRTDEKPPSECVAPTKSQNQNTLIGPDYQNLIEACKAADSGSDMKKVVGKLIKYYRLSPLEYVNSKEFRKLVRKVTDEVRTQPSLMFMKLTDLMEEMKTRHQTNGNNSAAASSPPVDPKQKEIEAKKAQKIELLSDALRKLQRKIRKCEQTEVDWDADDNSSYMLMQRYKERAYKIYVKLCELTGESRNAERIVKKAIKFNGTDFREFNKKLEKFVNETKSFPDMFDVISIMNHCNTKYDYGLDKKHRQSIAQVAFVKVGDLLQERRKRDFYEMVQYYTSNSTDPAREDETLKMKLDESHKHYSKRMNDVIEKYTMQQWSSDDGEERLTDTNDNQNASMSNAKKKSATVNNKPVTSQARESSSKKSPVPLSKSAEAAATTTSTKTPAQPPAQIMKMDTAIDINDADNDDDIEMIIPDADVDAIMGDEEFQGIEKDLFPTITSVTSLAQAGNTRFNIFEANPLENASIL